MKYTYTIMYVNDVAATLTFYEKAFGLPRKMIVPENDYGELMSGETTIAFATKNWARKTSAEDLSQAPLPIGLLA